MKNILQKIEFKFLLFLLKRFSNNELDQFENWKIKSKYGDVFISIDRQGGDISYTEVE